MGSGLVALGVVVGLLTTSVVGGFSLGAHVGLGCPGCTPSSRGVAPAVRWGPILGYPSPSTFWAVADQAPSLAPNSTLSSLVNATPITFFRYDGGVEATNQSLGLMYSDSGLPSTAVMNDSTFVTQCRWSHCLASLPVPAEIDDPGAAAATVRYVEHTLGFHPQYWSIGNEPIGWKHFGIPWSHWSPGDRSKCDASCFAALVHRYVPVLRSVDPHIRIIGLQDSDCANDSYLKAVVRVDGPNLSAVACHLYPEGTFRSPSAGQLYATLLGASSLPARIVSVRGEVRAACPNCQLPVFIDEYNAAWFGVPIMSGYSNAVFLAASLVQALRANVSQFAFFTLQATGPFGTTFGLLTPAGTPAPTYYVYSEFAKRLALHEVVAASIPGAPAGVFMVGALNGSARSILVVNTNLSHAVRFSLPTPSTWSHVSSLECAWGPAQATPNSSRYGPNSLPSTWTVPADSLLLVSSG